MRPQLIQGLQKPHRHIRPELQIATSDCHIASPAAGDLNDPLWPLDLTAPTIAHRSNDPKAEEKWPTKRNGSIQKGDEKGFLKNTTFLKVFLLKL